MRNRSLTIAMWDMEQAFSYEHLLEKLTLLEDKFKEIYEERIDDEDDFLIFVCPEYNLLPTRFYPNQYLTKQQYKDIQKKLNDLLANYPQAILIPGTGYVEKLLTSDNEEKQNKYSNFWDEWQKTTKKKGPHKFEEKKFVKNTTTIFHQKLSSEKNKNYSKKISSEHPTRLDNASVILYPGHGSPFFTKDGIRFGIEVCADHRKQVLVAAQSQMNTNLRDNNNNNNESFSNIQDNNIDVQIVISNVAYLNEDHIANNRKNILVINCAGNFSISSNLDAQFATEVWKYNEKGERKKINKDSSSTNDLYIYSVTIRTIDYEMESDLNSNPPTQKL